MIVHADDKHPTASRIRGEVAMRIIGELMMRLGGADSWEFAAFGRDEDVIAASTSTHGACDIAALRAEIRLQRFAGSVLPHVSTLLSSEQRRMLCAVFGEFNDQVAILRISRSPMQKPYGTRDGAGIERFFRQHSEAIAASIFDSNFEDAEGLASRREAPIAFTVDANGLLIATSDETDSDPSELRTHLMPRNGEVPIVLRGVVYDLLERRRSGATGNELIAVLPFALVRLTPLRMRGAAPASLITVEWLRSRASLSATAAQYSISKRELQVLALMLRGAPVAEIALELSISESTVVFHLKRMLKKTMSKNRTELAARMLGWQISAVG